MMTGELLEAIHRGVFDESLDVIRNACRERERAKSAALVRTLHVGSRVRIGNIRPKTLDGVTGTVTEYTGGRPKVRIDSEYAERAGKFAYSVKAGVALGIPQSCITEVLDDD